MVANEHFGNCHKIYIAVYATHMPHILAFEVRAVGPADYTYRDIVVACSHIAAYIELGIHITTLGVAYILAVHPYIGGRVDTVEVEQNTLVLPACGEGEIATIATHAIVYAAAHCDVGRIVGKSVIYVYIVWSTETIHLQTAGNRNVGPRRAINIVGIETVVRYIVFVFYNRPLKFPGAVKAHPTAATAGSYPGSGVV